MEQIKTPFLLATLEYPPQVGGVASFCAQVIKALPAHSIQVISNQEHRLLAKWGWPKWIKSALVLFKEAKRNQVKGVVVAQVLPLGAAAVLARFFYPFSLSIMVHGLDVLGPLSSTRKRWMLRLILNSANCIIANSRYTAKVVQHMGIDPKKITVLPLGPHHTPEAPREHEVWLQSLGVTPDDIIILSAARLVRRKGIDQMIAVLPEVIKQVGKKVKLVVVGDGPDKARLQSLVREAGLTNSVIFTGQVSDPQLNLLFSRCVIFSLPNREEPGGDVEGFGIVFIEANAFGKPVIGGKSGGVPDAIEDGVNGFLVEPLNRAMLLKALLRLLQHPEVAHTLGEQGKLRVAEHFDWKTNVHALAEQLGIPE